MSKPMIPCRHLDYDETKYIDCTIHTAAPHFPEVRFWKRGERWTDGGKNPTNVQFCRLRGRINEIFACYGEKHCYEPLTEVLAAERGAA